MNEDICVPLLWRLKKMPGTWVSPREAGLAPHQLQVELEKLGRIGAKTEYHHEHGGRLLHWPDVLLPDELSWELRTHVIGRRILVYEKTSSTQDVVWRLWESGHSEGVVVFAEAQDRGRGRHGRRWYDRPRASLLLSVLLTPRLPPDHAQAITVLGAVAACDTIERTVGQRVGIKWPNDVTIAGRKAAGVLVETRTRMSGAASAHVLGIGLNVNQGPEDFPESIRQYAISLRACTGRKVDRVSLARALIQELDARYMQLVNDGLEPLQTVWRNRCSETPELLTVQQEGRRFTGRVVDLDIREGLILQLPNGVLRSFRAEHVFVENPH